MEDAEAAIRHGQEDPEAAEHEELTTWKPKTAFHAIIVAIRDSLSGVAYSDHGEDGEDEDGEETEQGQLSEDDELVRVIGTITKTVQQRMERFRHKQMKLEQLTQPGGEDTADYLRRRNKM